MDGQTFRELRLKLAYSQAELAREIGVSANTVARWERGELPVNRPAARVLELLLLLRKRRKKVS